MIFELSVGMVLSVFIIGFSCGIFFTLLLWTLENRAIERANRRRWEEDYVLFANDCANCGEDLTLVCVCGKPTKKED